MIQAMRTCITLALAIIVVGISHTSAAQAPSPRIGIVIMHGKGGSPTKHVSDMASSLEEKGYLVANLEMPWSGRRDYDVSVSTAEREVESALPINLLTKLYEPDSNRLGAPSASRDEIVRWIMDVGRRAR